MQNILDITSNNAINGFKNHPTKEFYDSALDRWISLNSITNNFPWQSPCYMTNYDPSGEPVIDRTRKIITVTSNIICYGAAGSDALALKLAENIQNQWNAAGGKVTISGDVYDVKFIIIGTYSSTLTASDITNNTDIKNNYIQIIDSGIGVSEMDDVGSNTGRFLKSNIEASNSTTETHEFGHGYGLTHPTDLDLRRKGQPSIMYPRGTAVDKDYTYDPTKGATKGTPRVDATNTMNPTTRKVTQADIDNLGLDRINYDAVTGKGELGKLTNIAH